MNPHGPWGHVGETEQQDGWVVVHVVDLDGFNVVVLIIICRVSQRVPNLWSREILYRTTREFVECRQSVYLSTELTSLATG